MVRLSGGAGFISAEEAARRPDTDVDRAESLRLYRQHACVTIFRPEVGKVVRCGMCRRTYTGTEEGWHGVAWT